MVALIIIGVKVGHRPASPPQPTPVAAPVTWPPVGAGPPLMETGEAGTPGEPAPAAGPAAGQPPGPAQATPGRRG